MEILGLSPYIAAIVIAAIGVAATNLVGYLKSDGAFKPKKTVASVLIAVPVAILLVATELSVITIEAGNELAQLIIFIGLVAQVAGFDTFVKNAKAIVKKEDSD